MLYLVPVEPLQLQDADGHSSCLASNILTSDRPTTYRPFLAMTFPFYFGWFWCQCEKPKLALLTTKFVHSFLTTALTTGKLFWKPHWSVPSKPMLCERNIIFARPPTRDQSSIPVWNSLVLMKGFRFRLEVTPWCPIFWVIASCCDVSGSWSRDLEPI
jgi:hypothetical protein